MSHAVLWKEEGRARKGRATGLCRSLQSLNASPAPGDILVFPHLSRSTASPGPAPLPLRAQISNRPQRPVLRVKSECPGNPKDVRFGQFPETF